jgi:hypothetical protein
MEEKTSMFSTLLGALQALAREQAKAKAAKGGPVGEMTDEDLAAIAEQLGRDLSPTERDAVRAAYADEAKSL